MNNEHHNLVQTMFPPDGSNVKPYEWMINPTRQSQWIDKQGVFLWLAFFFSEIGAGLYFVSLFYSYRPGLVLGWLITLALGGAIHMAYLGNPLRAWRMIMRPRTSELSRGIWVIGIFFLLGFMQIFTANAFNIAFNTIMAILCLIIISHGFTTMNVIRALPAWSSTMVLPFSIISGVWVGQQILQFITAISSTSPAAAMGMEVWAKVFFFAYVLCLVLYAWGTFHSGKIGKESIKMMIRKEVKKITLAGVLGLAMVAPLIFTLIMWGGNTNAFLIFLRLAAVVAGDLAVRYVIMKSAVYYPLLERG